MSRARSQRDTAAAASSAGTSARGTLAMLMLACALAVASPACSRDVRHAQQPSGDEPRGWVTCRAGSVRLLAVNGEAVDEGNELIRVRDGGFRVALPPGEHTLLCQLERRNPHANQPGQPARLVEGEPLALVLHVVADQEILLKPQMHGNGDWDLVVDEKRQHEPTQ